MGCGRSAVVGSTIQWPRRGEASEGALRCSKSSCHGPYARRRSSISFVRAEYANETRLIPSSLASWAAHGRGGLRRSSGQRWPRSSASYAGASRLSFPKTNPLSPYYPAIRCFSTKFLGGKRGFRRQTGPTVESRTLLQTERFGRRVVLKNSPCSLERSPKSSYRLFPERRPDLLRWLIVQIFAITFSSIGNSYHSIHFSPALSKHWFLVSDHEKSHLCILVLK